MSWDVKFTRGDGQPLGAVTEVEAVISTVFPNVKFYSEPGGEAKIAELERRGIELPVALRDVFKNKPTSVQGDLSHEDYILQFFLGTGGPLRLLHVSIKGDNDLAAAELNKMAASSGWTLSEYSPRDEKPDD